MSVPSGRRMHAAAAGLLLWARLARDIDRLLHGRRPAVSSSRAIATNAGDAMLLADVGS